MIYAVPCSANLVVAGTSAAVGCTSPCVSAVVAAADPVPLLCAPAAPALPFTAPLPLPLPLPLLLPLPDDVPLLFPLLPLPLPVLLLLLPLLVLLLLLLLLRKSLETMLKATEVGTYSEGFWAHLLVVQLILFC